MSAAPEVQPALLDVKQTAITLPQANWEELQENWPQSPWVFTLKGVPLKNFRTSWKNACAREGYLSSNSMT